MTELKFHDYSIIKPIYRPNDFQRYLFICNYIGRDEHLRGRRIFCIPDSVKDLISKSSDLNPLFWTEIPRAEDIVSIARGFERENKCIGCSSHCKQGELFGSETWVCSYNECKFGFSNIAPEEPEKNELNISDAIQAAIRG